MTAIAVKDDVVIGATNEGHVFAFDINKFKLFR